jgi:hypothetical protein
MQRLLCGDSRGLGCKDLVSEQVAAEVGKRESVLFSEVSSAIRIRAEARIGSTLLRGESERY